MTSIDFHDQRNVVASILEPDLQRLSRRKMVFCLVAELDEEYIFKLALDVTKVNIDFLTVLSKTSS